MAVFDFFKASKDSGPTKITDVRPDNGDVPENSGGGWGEWNPIYFENFDGEKNPGEIGRIKKFNLDYVALRARSWQSYLTSDVTQDVIKKFALWVIGNGLKLQSEPVINLLEDAGIHLTPEQREKWTRLVENRYRLFTSDPISDYKEFEDFNSQAYETFKGAIVGGDMLVVNHYNKGVLRSQIIDGELVISPPLTSKYYKDNNKIRHGVELDKDGRHIAYYVRQTDGEVMRIPAYGPKTGRRFAYLVYGSRYRVDSVRGLPLIAAVMETIKKLDRYKEATVGSAEERQKIVYQIKHKEYSTGESVLSKNIASSFNANERVDKIDNKALEETAQKVAETTTRQAFNMPIGSEMDIVDSKNELYFEQFFNANVNLVCATIGIPPEVALSKYDSNFSSARAALKDWEHTMKVHRVWFAKQFYKRHYEFWLDMEVISGRISASGYKKALDKKDFYTLRAYRNARFVGPNVPHIDPEKEVKAERLKLGDLGSSLPLTTAEAATENLTEGDFFSNSEQFKNEIKDFPVVSKSPATQEKDEDDNKGEEND